MVRIEELTKERLIGVKLKEARTCRSYLLKKSKGCRGSGSEVQNLLEKGAVKQPRKLNDDVNGSFKYTF